MADRMVHRFNDVVRGGMKRRQHMAKPVEIRQIGKGRRTAHIGKIPQVGCAGHRSENGISVTEWQIVGGIARVIGERGRNTRDQFTHQTAVEMDGLVPHVRACPAPILERDSVAEHDTDLLKYRHRGRVNALDALPIQRLA